VKFWSKRQAYSRKAAPRNAQFFGTGALALKVLDKILDRGLKQIVAGLHHIFWYADVTSCGYLNPGIATRDLAEKIKSRNRL
jgi:hypothetical protein